MPHSLIDYYVEGACTAYFNKKIISTTYIITKALCLAAAKWRQVCFFEPPGLEIRSADPVWVIKNKIVSSLEYINAKWRAE